MDATDAIKIAQKPAAFNAPSDATTGKTYNMSGNVILRTSWPPRVMSSRVILEGGGLSREKCVLWDGKMRCMIQCISCELRLVARTVVQFAVRTTKGKRGTGVRDWARLLLGTKKSNNLKILSLNKLPHAHLKANRVSLDQASLPPRGTTKTVGQSRP